LLEHCVAPALHIPTQPPPAHVWPVQAIGAPHSPEPLHTSTALPEHCVVLMMHDEPPSPASSASGALPSLCCSASEPVGESTVVASLAASVVAPGETSVPLSFAPRSEAP
jgi:hypothetical protein